VRAARRRLRTESWHLLHLYAYIGVVSRLPQRGLDRQRLHLLADGPDLLVEPVVRRSLVAIVASGWALPWCLNLRHRLVVAQCRPRGRGLCPSTCPAASSTGCDGGRPGQFFVFRFLDGAGWSGEKPIRACRTDRTHRVLRITRQGPRRRPAGRWRPGPRTRVLVRRKTVTEP